MKTRTRTRGKTRTLLRTASPARRLRDLLSKGDLPEAKEMWKRLGESPLLKRSRTDPRFVEDGADLVFVSKDRSHAALIDCKLGEEGLNPRQAIFYVNQFAHLRFNLDFPLATASLLFVLPEGSPKARKLLAAFDEAYRLPVVGMRKSTLSEVRIEGRGSRLAKNAFRYSVTGKYKDQKFSFAIAVKVVEAPAGLFEATQVVPFANHIFVPIPGSGGAKK